MFLIDMFDLSEGCFKLPVADCMALTCIHARIVAQHGTAAITNDHAGPKGFAVAYSVHSRFPRSSL